MATLAAFGAIEGRVTAVTAVKDTTTFIGMDTGHIYKQTQADESIALSNRIYEPITALATDETSNFIGTARGYVWKQTISGDAIDATPLCKIDGAITSMFYDATAGVVWFSDDRGNLYSLTP